MAEMHWTLQLGSTSCQTHMRKFWRVIPVSPCLCTCNADLLASDLSSKWLFFAGSGFCVALFTSIQGVSPNSILWRTEGFGSRSSSCSWDRRREESCCIEWMTCWIKNPVISLVLLSLIFLMVLKDVYCYSSSCKHFVAFYLAIWCICCQFSFPVPRRYDC